MWKGAHEPLLHRVWELRQNVSAYDATYIALAEALDTILLRATIHSHAPQVWPHALSSLPLNLLAPNGTEPLALRDPEMTDERRILKDRFDESENIRLGVTGDHGSATANSTH